jgi:methyltransferase-like protein/protein-L-isoaspartate O-methyltransferase
MNQPASFSYDQMPYPSMSHANTHPDHLAVMAILAGLHPAPLENCRVLELGSASGGNLIPMAYSLPHSQFLGIDLSTVQIAEGQRKIEQFGLMNLRLEQMDILDFPDNLGQFDYIIAHGIFSWVPVQVREKILAIYRTHLAPHGVGFISYNTYPGWYMINIARDLMRFDTRDIADPVEKVSQARAALRFYANAIPAEKNGYYSFLKAYSNNIDIGQVDQGPKHDSALFHDEIAELNQPFYFTQFIEMAEQHGLRFLADLCHADHRALPPDVMEVLRKKSNTLVELEQAQDFLEDRTFRQTLLCQEEAPLNRKLTPESVKNLFIASQAQPAAENPDLYSRSVEKFFSQDGAVLSIDHPCSKAAMVCLAEVWPRPLAFAELLACARARLKTNGGSLGEEALDAQVLGFNMLRAFGYNSSLVELHSYSPPLANPAGDRPVASRVVRIEAEADKTVTNLRHERVSLDELERYLVPHLDGTQDLHSLIQILKDGPLANGTVIVEKDGKQINLTDHPELLVQELEYRLEWLTKAAIFIDPTRVGG